MSGLNVGSVQVKAIEETTKAVNGLDETTTRLNKSIDVVDSASHDCLVRTRWFPSSSNDTGTLASSCIGHAIGSIDGLCAESSYKLLFGDGSHLDELTPARDEARSVIGGAKTVQPR